MLCGCGCVYLCGGVSQRVKALQKELSLLKVSKSVIKALRPQILNGNSDMQNGKREKGAGYWDKEHHDDSWVPVSEMFSKLEKRTAAWSAEEAEKQRDMRFDNFVDDATVEAPVVKAGVFVDIASMFVCFTRVGLFFWVVDSRCCVLSGVG